LNNRRSELGTGSDEPVSQPEIMINFMRDPKTGSIVRTRTVPFKPGMVIERGGRRYQVDKKGTQRRVK